VLLAGKLFKTLAITVALSAITLYAQVPVTTYHNDNSRTGQNTSETILTTSTVNAGQFGKLFSQTVDGYVYAQPLYVPNLTVGGTSHNVLFVATEHDSLYAFDADSNTGANALPLWKVSFINPPSVTTVDSNNDAGCGDLVPEIGITSTPVIDLTTNTIYLTVKTKESGVFHLRLHALDITTGAEKFGGPVDIQGTYTVGTTTITYNPLIEAQRAALLLVGSNLYISTASHCDNGPYHGWVFAYTVGATPMTRSSIWVAAPTGNDSGIWMAGDGPGADADGNIYFATGNGTWDGVNNFGDSIVRLNTSGGLVRHDYFTPYNQLNLSNADSDLGSGGVLLLPDQSGAHIHEVIESGKEGTIYVVNRDGMGGFNTGGNDSQIVQSVTGQIQGTWSTPAYWNGNVYFGGSGDTMKAFSVTAGMLSLTPTSHTGTSYGFPGPTPTVSSNGNSNGIVWALQNDGYSNSTAAILHAYDATALGTELYNSTQNSVRDGLGLPVKFSVPTVVNGKVYVGTQSAINVFGIVSALPQAAAPTIYPFGGTFNSDVKVTLTSSVPGAVIYYTTNGKPATTSSTVYSSPFIAYSSTTVNAIVAASGYNASQDAFATITIVGPSASINKSAGFSTNGLTLNGNSTLSATRLRITDGNANEASSAFLNTPITISKFTTDFAFQLTSASADGFAFVIQGTGATALGSDGGGLGYGPDPGVSGGASIGKSIALKFDLYDNSGEGSDSTGLYQNGASPSVPAVDMTSSGVNLHSGDVFNAHLVYDGTKLTLSLVDAQTAQSFTTSWTVNIPSTIGSTSAWIGFSGSTGGLTAVQDILNWTYASNNLQVTPRPIASPGTGTYLGTQTVTLSDTVAKCKYYYTTDGSAPTVSSTPYTGPIAVSSTTTLKAIAVAPGMAASFLTPVTITIETPSINYGTGFTAPGLQLNGSSALNGTRLRLTNGGGSEAASAFYTTPVSTTSFTTEFTFQLTSASADGFAFVIQNVGTTALGASGGSLGYQGINNSIAVKFDLYDNAGEGVDSIGLFQNGAAPFVPSIDLTPFGIDLHSGDTMTGRITYSAGSLGLTITDTVNHHSFTHYWPINVPTVIGSSTAFAGFTAGTGGATAIQDIVKWQLGN